MKHHLMLTIARGRHYAHCSCGWASEPYTTTTGAHLAFADHLTRPAETDNGEDA